MCVRSVPPRGSSDPRVLTPLRRASLGALCLALAATSPAAGGGGEDHPGRPTPTVAQDQRPQGGDTTVSGLSAGDISIVIPGCTDPQYTDCSLFELDCLELIYDESEMGNPLDSADFPDLPVRAIRTGTGPSTQVQILIPNSGWFDFQGTNGNYRMIGPDFDNLVFSQTPVMDSNIDPSPCMFNDQAWIASLYKDETSGDIHAVIHNEYWGNQHNSKDFQNIPNPPCGNCAQSRTCCLVNINRVCPGRNPACISLHCRWASLTAGISTDGGASFQQRDDLVNGSFPKPIATAPYQYGPNQPGQLHYGGMNKPSNIVKSPKDGMYYMVFNTHLPDAYENEYGGIWSQLEYTGIMRNADLNDPNGWRAWGGPRMEFSNCIGTGGGGSGGGGGSAGPPTDPGPLKKGKLAKLAVRELDNFEVRLRNPYPQEPDDHSERVPYPLDPYWFWCPPVTVGAFSDTLTYNTYLNAFVVMGSAPFIDSNSQLRRGIFYSVSEDLLSWTDAALLHECVSTPDWAYAMYPSIIDPDSPSDSFDVSDQETDVYFTVHPSAASAAQDLWRVSIRFELN